MILTPPMTIVFTWATYPKSIGGMGLLFTFSIQKQPFGFLGELVKWGERLTQPLKPFLSMINLVNEFPK